MIKKNVGNFVKRTTKRCEILSQIFTCLCETKPFAQRFKVLFLCDVGLKRHVQSVSGGGGEGASSNVWTIFLT